MLKRTPKAKKSFRLMYDWGRGKRDPELRLDGVSGECLLSPVRVMEDGTSSRKFTKGEWSAGQVMIHWLWPGHRVQTLLRLLQDGRLTGCALENVTTLDRLLRRKNVEEGKSKAWAKAFIAQEKELRTRSDAREKAERRALARKRNKVSGVSGDSSGRKQNSDAA